MVTRTSSLPSPFASKTRIGPLSTGLAATPASGATSKPAPPFRRAMAGRSCVVPPITIDSRSPPASFPTAKAGPRRLKRKGTRRSARPHRRSPPACARQGPGHGSPPETTAERGDLRRRGTAAGAAGRRVRQSGTAGPPSRFPKPARGHWATVTTRRLITVSSPRPKWSMGSLLKGTRGPGPAWPPAPPAHFRFERWPPHQSDSTPSRGDQESPDAPLGSRS